MNRSQSSPHARDAREVVGTGANWRGMPQAQGTGVSQVEQVVLKWECGPNVVRPSDLLQDVRFVFVLETF